MPRFIATFDVPDDTNTQDVALWLDSELPWQFRYKPEAEPAGNPVDSTVYASEHDYLTDLEEMVCRTGHCFRCGTEVTEQLDKIALDSNGTNICWEGDELDTPHEIDEP